MHAQKKGCHWAAPLHCGYFGLPPIDAASARWHPAKHLDCALYTTNGFFDRACKTPSFSDVQTTDYAVQYTHPHAFGAVSHFMDTLHPPPPASLLLTAPVLVVEDEPSVTQRIRALLLDMGYETTALLWAESVAQAREIYAHEPIALALVDLGLPDGSGHTVIEELRARDPAMMILVISAWSTEDAILGALRAGATGYLLKERDDLELRLGIASTLRGGAPIDPFIAKRIMQEFAAAPKAAVTAGAADAPAQPLSGREQEILQLVAQGMTNREIAEHLNLSKYTVECHVKKIYQKMAVSSRTRAIHIARQHGLID